MKTSTRKQYLRLLRYALVVLVAISGLIYGYDLLLGDGDGVIARFGLNPLTILLTGGLSCLLLRAAVSTHKWVANGATILLSSILTLALIEFSLPLFAKNMAGVRKSISAENGIFPYTSFDTVYFKNYHPNNAFSTILYLEDGGKKRRHLINSDAMRGPEIGPKKEKQKRILLVGDSYIQSIQVDYEQSIGPCLDRLNSDNTQVLQHGFPSWSPLLEWNWLLRKGLSLQPDTIVLFLYYNDFFSGNSVGDSGYTPYALFDQTGKPNRFEFPAASLPQRTAFTLMMQSFQNIRLLKIYSFMRRHQQAYNSISHSDLQDFQSLPAKDFQQIYEENQLDNNLLHIANWDLVALFRDTSLWSSALRDRTQLSLDYISGISEVLKQNNISFHVSFIPSIWEFADEGLSRKTQTADWEDSLFPHQGIYDRVAFFCQENDISYLDLFEAFSSYKSEHPDQQLYYTQDTHFNETGHRVAAAAVHDFLSTVAEQGRSLQ